MEKCAVWRCVTHLLLFADDGDELDVVIVVLPRLLLLLSAALQQTEVTRAHFASVAVIRLRLVDVLAAPILLLLPLLLLLSLL